MLIENGFKVKEIKDEKTEKNTILISWEHHE